MKSSFAREPIGKLLKAIVDNRGKTVPTADDGIPLIATNCIKESSLYPTFENIRYVSEKTHRTWFRAHLQPEDILFVNKGTPGRVCMVPDPVNFCAAQDMIGLRADRSKVYPRYLFAFLRSDWVKETIRNYHVGLVIPHFKKQDLDTITVPKRSNDEQKAIGDLYFLLSEKIEINNRINEELEGMAKLLYDYWFVQFDFPITAAQAAAMGKPKLEGKPYRASGGKMIYNQVLKREIPEAWEISDLGGICNSVRDTVDPAAVAAATPYVGLEHVPRRQFFLDAWESAELVKSLKSSFLKGDILFGKLRPYFHKVVKVAMDGICTSELLVLRAKEPKFEALIGSIVFSDIFVESTSKQWGGAQMPRADWKRMEEFKFPLPPDDLLKVFNERILPLCELGGSNQQQNQELTKLRDWLLPMLMNGQVTVG